MHRRLFTRSPVSGSLWGMLKDDCQGHVLAMLPITTGVGMMKQVIAVNRALNLPAGKLAAQVAHAAVGAFLAAPADVQAAWVQAGMPKIVVYAGDEAALLALESAAQQRRIPVCLIRDEGRTVVSPGTITCIGIGPALAASIDSLTGSLPLV